jgi:DNA-binding NarL/FixJ family response regulator
MDRGANRGAVPIVVVEDNRLLREGIVAILSRYPDLDVVGVADDVDSALSSVSAGSPKVVLVDAGMGDGDSHDLVEQIVGTFADARVIVMDILPDPDDVFEFVRRGASGFVMKDTSIDEFVDTIRTVASGGEVLPPDLTNTVFSYIAQRSNAAPRSPDARAMRLTPREHEVIALIADGMSNKAIARALGISPHTVKSHVRNILEKLALHSRLQVALYAHDTGAGSSETEE